MKTVQAVPNYISKGNRNQYRRILAAFHPGEGKQTVDQFGEPDAFLQDGVGSLLGRREHPLFDTLGIATDGHEGIAQLMGDILEEVLLHLGAPLELAGHLIHGFPQLLQFP